MNTKLKSILKTITLSLGALLLVTTATYAIGTLTPSGTAGDDTQYTLNDIYTRLTTNEAATEGTGTSTTPGTVEATFRTLTEIYDAIPTIDATKVATGTSYLGVVGTLATSTPELVWSTEQGSMDWFTAVSTCAGTVDGSTGWRLPTISELLVAISDDWIIDQGLEQGDRFASDRIYWSDTQYSGSNAWYANWGGNVNGDSIAKYFSWSVRCVR